MTLWYTVYPVPGSGRCQKILKGTSKSASYIAYIWPPEGNLAHPAKSWFSVRGNYGDEGNFLVKTAMGQQTLGLQDAKAWLHFNSGVISPNPCSIIIVWTALLHIQIALFTIKGVASSWLVAFPVCFTLAFQLNESQEGLHTEVLTESITSNLSGHSPLEDISCMHCAMCHVWCMLHVSWHLDYWTLGN